MFSFFISHRNVKFTLKGFYSIKPWAKKTLNLKKKKCKLF